MLRNGEVIGVLAVAMVEQFDESADVWQAMQQMVAAVSA
jgi:hypothetical protein